jgi:DNA repair protein RecO (recombination protein O)
MFNYAVAIINSILKERGELGHLYRIFLNLLNMTGDSNYKNLLPFFVDFLLNVMGFFGININVNKCFVSGTSVDICYISPKTGNCVSGEVGKKYERNLFKIPKSLYQYSEDGRDILETIDILHHFLHKIFLEQNIVHGFGIIETFKKILTEEIRKAY